MDKLTEKILKRYDRIAKIYDVYLGPMEKGKMAQWRRMLFLEARGKVLEVGVGTGHNIPYYHENMQVTAIDFSPAMIEKARVKAEKFHKKVEFILMDAQELKFPDETFDTIVTTCVFCSVPDAVKGLKEIRRVCKKDGQIIMIEHVKSKNKIVGFLMELMNPAIVSVIGANINRDTVNNLKNAGLKVEIEKDLMLDIVKYLKSTRSG